MSEQNLKFAFSNCFLVFKTVLFFSFFFFYISIFHRKPDDWTLSWGGSGQIWVWGHNHRGQLGGVEGAKVKLPVSCESLASLRPVQLIGGEQTLFAVTADGKVLIIYLTKSNRSHLLY